jgi:hypothetical protein
MPLYPDTSVGSGGGGAVTSVFGRIGAVVALLGDYAASLITNDSSVPGATVKDALENLDSRTWREIGPVVVAASATVAIDTIATGDKGIIWHLLLNQGAGTKLTQVTIHGVCDGTTPLHITPEEVGTIQSFVTATVMSGGSLELRLTNNEAGAITVTGKVIEI